MKKKTTLGARLRYGFDKTMAAGPIALIGWLAVVSLLIIIIPMVLLQAVVATVFMERHWQMVTQRLSMGVTRRSSASFEAGAVGNSPCRSCRAATNASMGLRTHAGLCTSGIAGRWMR